MSVTRTKAILTRVTSMPRYRAMPDATPASIRLCLVRTKAFGLAWEDWVWPVVDCSASGPAAGELGAEVFMPVIVPARALRGYRGCTLSRP